MLRTFFVIQIVIISLASFVHADEPSAKIHPCIGDMSRATTLGSAEISRCLDQALNAFLLDALEQISDRVEQRVNETGLEAAVRKVDDFGIITQVVRKAFGDVKEWTEIPGSRGAAFCALARVDDDTRIGKCELYTNDGKWQYRTGGGSDDQACTAICLFIQVTDSSE